MKQLITNRAILVALVAAIAILAFSVWIHYDNTVQLDEDAGLVAHTHEVLDSAANVMRSIVDAQTGMRGFVISTNREFLRPYENAVAKLPNQISELQQLVHDNPKQSERVKRLEKLGGDYLNLAARTIEMAQQNPEAARKFITARQDKQLMDPFRVLIAEIEASEHLLLTDRKEKSRAAFNAAITTNLITTGLALLIVMICGLLVYRDNQLRKDTEITLREYNADLESRIEIRTAELKEAKELAESNEQRTRLIVDTAHDAFLAIDANGRIIDWNQQADNVFGWSRDDVIGKDFAELIIPVEYREAQREGLRRFVETGMGPMINKRLELTALRLGSYPFPVELTVAPIKRKEGYIFGAFVRDITQRRQYESEMRIAKETAESASRAKSEFLANMSHEIRTPMNGIIGMTELTLGTSLTAQQRDYITTVQQSADSLMVIINDILDFSKIEARKLELDPIPFALRDSLGDTLKPLAVKAHEKSLELAYHVDPSVPDGLIGDLTRIQQIIVNLAGNAIKFTSKGEVVVRARRESLNGDDIVICFAVVDTGIGIHDEKLESIFAPFAQADGSMTRKFGGTGLGLTISSRLVELMGGRLTVKSKPGVGTTFEFTCKLKVNRENPAPQKEPELIDLNGLSVLVVDDNITNGRILEEILTNWQFCPTIVRSGAEAIEAFENASRSGKAFRLILLDATLPDISGVNVAERLNSSRIPGGDVVVMLTSAAGNIDKVQCKELGIAICLTKPVKQSDLLEAIQLSLSQNLKVVPVKSSKSQEAALQWKPGRRPLNILLAEDNYFNQRVLLGTLASSGHTIRVVENGQQAVEATKNERFDLVLMDVQMPVMDGIEATQIIRERDFKTGTYTPIIALTAHAMTGDRERFLAAGMDEYISKPIRRKDLIDAIGKYDGNPSDRQSEGPDNGLEILDRKSFVERVGGNVDLAIQLVEIFPAECKTKMQELRIAQQGGDRSCIRSVAHTLSGMLGQVGASASAAAAHALESKAADSKAGNLDVAITDLEKQVSRLLPEAASFLEELKRSFQ